MYSHIKDIGDSARKPREGQDVPCTHFGLVQMLGVVVMLVMMLMVVLAVVPMLVLVQVLVGSGAGAGIQPGGLQPGPGFDAGFDAGAGAGAGCGAGVDSRTPSGLAGCGVGSNAHESFGFAGCGGGLDASVPSGVDTRTSFSISVGMQLGLVSFARQPKIPIASSFFHVYTHRPRRGFSSWRLKRTDSLALWKDLLDETWHGYMAR